MLFSKKVQPKIVFLILLTNILEKIAIHFPLLPVLLYYTYVESILSGPIYFILYSI